MRIRKDKSSSPTDMLPDYKRFGNTNKPQKHTTRNLVALAGLCLVLYLFIRSSEITATLGISSPTRQKGPRGFTSAAGFEASARHREQLKQQQHGRDRDDGSYIVDTTSDQAAGELHQAKKMDESSLQGSNAPHFVGDKLVDPPDFDPTGPKAKADATGAIGAAVNKAQPHGVYSLTAVDIDGQHRSLEEFAGKVTIIVNVASKCGYTDANYKGLQLLYDKYKASGLEVLAFPCNQFGNQEPGTDAEVKQFATGQYHTTFPMFSKVDVNGPSTHSVYEYLKKELHVQDPPGLAWNFQKILVNRAGKPVLLMQQDWDQGRVEHAAYNLLISASV